jgi:hypothetical protein
MPDIEVSRCVDHELKTICGRSAKRVGRSWGGVPEGSGHHGGVPAAADGRDRRLSSTDTSREPDRSPGMFGDVCH